MKVLVSLILLVFLSMPGLAREARVDEVPNLDDAKPGKIALLTGEKGMRYFVRLPRNYDEEQGARLIVFLHGSNMNGLQYLQTFEAQRWCREDILVCPNGEAGDEPFGNNNFTFGSAPYVAEIVDNVRKVFKISRTYVGGHSQGGFLTYSVIMHHPELFDGAFPMAGDCWMQNEPNLWETKPEVMAKQKEVALAVIHGQSDPVVPFSQGEHAYGIFLAMGYPKLRFFAPKDLGHQFGLSPVPEALAWLDAMSGLDPEASMELASKWGKDEKWGWVHQAALAVLGNQKADPHSVSVAESAVAAVEREAGKAVMTMKASLASKPAKEWLPEWFEFRLQFGATDAARELVNAYDSARALERDQGSRLFRSAVAFRREKDKESMRETLNLILDEAPHTYHAWYAVDWLEK